MVSKKSKLWITVTMIFLILMALISVGPLFWVVMSSFKTTKETMKDAFALPQNWNFDGYKVALDISPIFKFYGNSLIISLASTPTSLVSVVNQARSSRFGRGPTGPMLSSQLNPETKLPPG